jgi:ubiquinone biosynthesis protein
MIAHALIQCRARCVLVVALLLSAAAPSRAAGPDPQVAQFRAALETAIPDSFFQGSLMGSGPDAAKQDRQFLVDMLCSGFAKLDAIERMALGMELAGLQQASSGKKLATLLGALGPGYIKLGQVLGNRPDLVGETDRKELERLSDQAPAVPFATVKDVVEKTSGKKLDQIFRSFNPVPLGSGSIGQAHRAVLLDGTVVVVKIAKPGAAAKLMANLDDIEAAAKGQGSLIKALRPVFSELRRAAKSETNLRNEANAIERAARSMTHRPDEAVPTVFRHLSNSSVLVETLARGSAITGVAQLTGERATNAEKVYVTTLRQVFVDGFFHADPHKGNVFLHQGTRTYIDWGLAAEIGYVDRSRLLGLAGTLATGNKRAIVAALQQLAVNQVPPAALEQVVARALETRLPPAAQMQDLMIKAQVEGLAVRPELILAGKALYQAEGVARSLDPNFSTTAALMRFTKESATAAPGALMRGFSPRAVLGRARQVAGALLRTVAPRVFGR